MLDLESELRAALHEQAAPSVDLAAMDAHVARLVHRRTRTRRTRGAALVAAAVVALATVTGALVGRNNDDHLRVSTGPPPTTAGSPVAVAHGHWATIAPPPMTDAFASVWTGTQLVVAFRPAPGYMKFAAYDPGHDHWTRVPDPPLQLQAPFSDSPTFTWTGHEVLVWAYENPGGDTFSGHHRLLSYNPATRHWRRLASPPTSQLIVAHFAWTGKDLLVFGGNFNGENAPAQGMIYDPASNTWRRIQEPPLSTREGPTTVWTGHELIVWSGISANAEGSRPLTAADQGEGEAFDPATNSWQLLPPSGLPVLASASGAWTGREMVVVGSRPDGRGTLRGAVFNPATRSWRAIAATPLSMREGMSSVWTGRSLFLWGGSAVDSTASFGDGATYSPATNRWQRLPAAPLSPRGGAVMAWDGKLVYVIEGGTSTGDAVVYRP